MGDNENQNDMKEQKINRMTSNFVYFKLSSNVQILDHVFELGVWDFAIVVLNYL